MIRCDQAAQSGEISKFAQSLMERLRFFTYGGYTSSKSSAGPPGPASPTRSHAITPADTSITRRLRFSTNPRLRRRFMVTDEPVQANLRVGLMLEALDKLAEDVALRFARTLDPRAKVVTAAMDQMKVHHAPEVTGDILLRARINLIGRTSMEVGIRVEQAGPEPRHLASCYFTMVARLPALTSDQPEQGLILTPLQPRTAKDKQRAAAALERRSARTPETSHPPTPDEYQALQALHSEQDKPGKTLLLATAVTTHGWERTYPEYENVPQTIFGGYVAHRAYMYAHICAELVAPNRPLLVSIDRINFYQPVRMGDKLHFLSRVTHTGRTSLTVETEITRISRDRAMTALSNTCIFTFVNVDAALLPLPVPTIYPTTYAEDARFLHAYRRRKRHLEQTAT